jgi:hypothetical protein
VTGHDRIVQGTDARSRPPSRSRITFVVRGPISRADLQGLSDRFRRCLWASDAFLIECDVSSLMGPQLESVDALARFELIGQQEGVLLRVRGASAELRELLEFVGLSNVVELCT